MEEKSEKEKRIRALTNLYYSNPKVQEAILKFSKDREVVPRYFEGFGKRPDTLQYPSDIIRLVQKGATLFHGSEEIWNDALQLSSDITKEKMDELRKGWDLLIDVDSKYLDYSKIATKLIIGLLEEYGIKNYGIKFSGSKGFHIIVSGKAFPDEYEGQEKRRMFPEWPRAICGFIMKEIKPKFYKIVGESDLNALQIRTNLTKEEIIDVICPSCGRKATQGVIVKLDCPVCWTKIERRNPKMTKRRLRCLNEDCAGVLEIVEQKESYYCEECKIYEISSMKSDDVRGHVQQSAYSISKNSEDNEFEKGIAEKHSGGLDLVLVAPRHLFRMPYSLHEKTSLASAVIRKEQIDGFAPRDADPLKVQIIDYLPDNGPGEAKRLLSSALYWKKSQEIEEEKTFKEKYSGKEYEKMDISGVTDEMFPIPIKKLMKGLNDGKKRGLFILITFLKSLNYSPDQINLKIREWNKLNEPPLREGYVKSQIEWHLKQKKKILPPNYSNESFYKDLGLLDKKPDVKNPLVEVMRKLRKKRNK